MPRFVTISPTHIKGMKKHAWQGFLDGEYIAIGWLQHTDLTGMSINEIHDLVRAAEYGNEASALKAFSKFLSLEEGDIVAVNNAIHGLFGVGEVAGEYKFRELYHYAGSEDDEDNYSHLRRVRWTWTTYVSRNDLVGPGETSWEPYGTMGSLMDEVPVYIRRLLGERPSSEPEPDTEFEVPDFLRPVVKEVAALREDSAHLERAHESLVESLLVALGYEKHQDIVFRQGSIDISIHYSGRPVVVFEVKRDWNLNMYSTGAIRQAYGYALDYGSRWVVVTNGDNYMLFDRLKGLSIESNVVSEFQLSALSEDDLDAIDRLRPERVRQPDIREAFQAVAECFGE